MLILLKQSQLQQDTANAQDHKWENVFELNYFAYFVFQKKFQWFESIL